MSHKPIQKQHLYLYWEFHELEGRQAVRMGKWKGVKYNVLDRNKTSLRGGKQSVYEGGLRISAFFVWANQIKAGSVSTQIALTMDIYPTISEITGAKINHKIDGVSLLSILRNPVEELVERPVFFTRREGNPRYGGQTETVAK